MSKKVMGLATPSVLKWARETAGYSVEEVVAKLDQEGKITASTVGEWESEGDLQPTYTQLENLAKLYKRPVVIFFFPEPPQEETPKVQMRSLPEGDADELPPNMRFLIRKAVIRQLDLAEIYDEQTPIEYQKFKDDAEDLKDAIKGKDSDFVASYIRNYLKVTIDTQRNWREIKDALKQWRKAVEQVGIWVFKAAFHDDKYSGFSLPSEKFPIIYLNNSMTKGRQIFTLFHELGHLLLGVGGIDFRKDVSDKFEDQYRGDEVFCNAFAAELLVPSGTLPEPTTSTPDTDEIEMWANKYKVSRIVILRRWLSRGSISKEYYQDKSEQLWYQYQEYIKVRKEEMKGKSTGNYYRTQITYLGDKYLERTFQRYHERRISEYQLADYLNIKLSLLDNLRKTAFGRGGGR